MEGTYSQELVCEFRYLGAPQSPSAGQLDLQSRGAHSVDLEQHAEQTATRACQIRWAAILDIFYQDVLSMKVLDL